MPHESIVICPGGGNRHGCRGTHRRRRIGHVLVLEKAAEHSFSLKKFYLENKLVTANYREA